MMSSAAPDSTTPGPEGQLDQLETAVALMARIGACWSPGFSPDGARIACISDLTSLPQVWTVAVEGGWPELVTPLDDQIYRVAWSPDGAWLAFKEAYGWGIFIDGPQSGRTACTT